MYNTLKHGNAVYNSFAQLPDSFTITEGTDAVPLRDQKFAMMVYQVNDTPISLSGVSLNASVGLDGTGAVHVNSNQLMVSDASVQAATNELVITNTFSRIIKNDASYTYTMLAAPGSLSGNAVWRISRTDSVGSRMWADGNANFDNVASNYLAITYTF